MYLSASSELKSAYQADLLGGVTTISGEVKLRKDKGDGMYRELDEPEWQSFRTQFIPYYAWSNRGTAEMTVWMPYLWE